MKIRILPDTCAGNALCTAYAPEVYELGDDGLCCSDGKSVPAELEEQARLGERYCPMKAIELVNTEAEQ